MTMLERIEKAICGPCLGNPREMAIAAVKAMRMPTDEMFEAAKPYGLCMSALDDAWQDMHDAILSEPQEQGGR